MKVDKQASLPCLNIMNKPNSEIGTVSELVQYFVPAVVYIVDKDRMESPCSVCSTTFFDFSSGDLGIR
jgi:hypothetical protein